MFYRRKIILALFQLFNGDLEKIRLQKLLFLFTKTQEKPVYDFIPYKFGCFSFSANADLTTMVRKEMLIETDKNFVSSEKNDYFNLLKQTDRINLLKVKELYGNMNTNELMKFTYINFPYWATNSEKAKAILSKDEYQKVIDSKPENNKIILFTIGYEGISLEEYFNKLLKNEVKVLVDVRKNALSMKFGFSKSLLKRYCESLKIEYIHFPEVGIQSEQRQELNSQLDYDKLFDTYKSNNLTSTTQTQDTILSLLKKNKRIALTCFEANICQCHRKHLAEAIENLPQFNYEVKHI